jgi:hypothetical protein
LLKENLKPRLTSLKTKPATKFLFKKPRQRGNHSEHLHILVAEKPRPEGFIFTEAYEACEFTNIFLSGDVVIKLI